MGTEKGTIILTTAQMEVDRQSVMTFDKARKQEVVYRHPLPEDGAHLRLQLLVPMRTSTRSRPAWLL